MLTEKELRKIALDACVEMMGADFVEPRKNLSGCCYGFSDDGMFDYSLGMDEKERKSEKGVLVIGNTPMDYYAFVKVNPNTGEVTRNYEDSVLPA